MGTDEGSASDYVRALARERGSEWEDIQAALSRREGGRSRGVDEIRRLGRLTLDQAMADAESLTNGGLTGGLTVPQAAAELRRRGYDVADDTLYQWRRRAGRRLSTDGRAREALGMFWLRVEMAASGGRVSRREYDAGRVRRRGAFDHALGERQETPQIRRARRLIEVNSPSASSLERRWGSWEAALRAAERLDAPPADEPAARSAKPTYHRHVDAHRRMLGQLRQWAERQPAVKAPLTGP